MINKTFKAELFIFYINMDITKNNLLNISSIDGRYSRYTKHLSNYFSEHALNKYRVFIEIEYFIWILEILEKSICQLEINDIMNIYKTYSIEDSVNIKKIEKNIQHDVKAVEYFIREKFREKDLSKYNTFIHFGLTSQDINNTAIPLSIKDYIYESYIPEITKLIKNLEKISREWNVVMISRTHGQTAVPTTMEKEVKVFLYRLEKNLEKLKNYQFYGKFGGAVGNLNAHYFISPKKNWRKLCDTFLEERIGLKRHQFTTQIDNYDYLSILFDNIKRINTILIDFSRDFWSYISMDYIKLKKPIESIGSSTMPHKVNPIDFENAEGNLLFANTMLEFLSRKLPISRLQRDLTDSTILRNLGSIFGHITLAFQKLINGINKCDINTHVITRDCYKNNIVLLEGLQTYLRFHNYDRAYEVCKDFAKKNPLCSLNDIHTFIDSILISNNKKIWLKENLNIETYIGFLNHL